MNTLNPKLFDEKLAQKIHLTVDYLTDIHADALIPDLSIGIITRIYNKVNCYGVDLRGVEPLLPNFSDQVPHRRRPTPRTHYTMKWKKHFWSVIPAWRKDRFGILNARKRNMEED